MEMFLVFFAALLIAGVVERAVKNDVLVLVIGILALLLAFAVVRVSIGG